MLGDQEEGEGDTGDPIEDNTVTNQSSGSKLQAQSVGTYNDQLEATQVISFNKGDKFFKNKVTLGERDPLIRYTGSSSLQPVSATTTALPSPAWCVNGM